MTSDSPSPRCFYFGCWNEAGHYLFAPGRVDAFRVIGTTYRVEHYGSSVPRHIDASLAPRVYSNGKITWAGAHEKASRVEFQTEECPPGQFLLHHLDNGFTAIQWWDRSQGDTRGACNSTVLLEGVHTAEEMLAALHQHFPHVVENIQRGGPPKHRERQAPYALVEVHATEQEKKG